MHLMINRFKSNDLLLVLLAMRKKNTFPHIFERIKQESSAVNEIRFHGAFMALLMQRTCVGLINRYSRGKLFSLANS